MTDLPLTRPWFAHYDPDVPHTVKPFDKPLFSFLDAAAENYPRRPAIIFQNTRISFAELRADLPPKN